MKVLSKKEYLETLKFIWKNFVPKSGQAEFVQGELLRAIEKLRDEAQRNGNGNFSEKCHVLLITFLREKLIDKKVFSERSITQINKDLDRLQIERDPYIKDDLFDRICHRIVDWCLIYKEPILNKKNPELQC